MSDRASRRRTGRPNVLPPPTTFSAGDQWPGHAKDNPDKIHVSANMAASFARVDARLQALEPRITIPMTNLSEEDRRRAEATEQVAMTWLELSGWEVWRETLCLVRSIYGKGVLKPFWNARDKRGVPLARERRGWREVPRMCRSRRVGMLRRAP